MVYGGYILLVLLECYLYLVLVDGAFESQYDPLSHDRSFMEYGLPWLN
jgi:hypothetical protein